MRYKLVRSFFAAAIALALMVLAACTAPYVPPVSGGGTADYVQENGNKLGWAGIHLQDTRQTVEQKLGQTLSPFADGYPACGDWSAEFTLQGRKVILQLTSDDADATVSSISVDLPDNEFGVSMAAMASTILWRFRGLKTDWKDEDSIGLVQSDRQMILIKNHVEHFIDITHSECLD